jgi:anti-sigma B factor antagonist
MNDFSVTHKTQGGINLLTVTGDLDVSVAHRLREAIIALYSTGKHVVIDLRRSKYLDATGLGVLVGAKKRLESDGLSLVLVCDEDSNIHILKLFKITGLAHVFNIAATPEQAFELLLSTTDEAPAVS